MSRRTFCLGLASAALAPSGGAAPQAKGLRRIGVLGVEDFDEDDIWGRALTGELRRQGYVEGKTFMFLKRACGTDVSRLDSMAAELIALGVDVIFATSGAAVPVLRRATQTVPIVMLLSADPVENGLVASLAHPGGNVTGNAVANSSIGIKQLEILLETLPSAKRIAYIIYQPHRSLPFMNDRIAQFDAMARRRGVELRTFEASEGRSLEGAFREVVANHADGVVLQNWATIGLDNDQVAALALKYRLPTIMEVRGYAASGVLFSYGVSYVDLYRKAGIYLSRILAGAKPADLPVELPTLFEFVINMETASALGVTIPPSVLLRADELIR